MLSAAAGTLRASAPPAPSLPQGAHLLDKGTDANTTALSHVKPGDTPFRGDGLRDFSLYRDLGAAAATGGQMLAQRVIAHHAPEKGTG